MNIRARRLTVAAYSTAHRETVPFPAPWHHFLHKGYLWSRCSSSYIGKRRTANPALCKKKAAGVILSVGSNDLTTRTGLVIGRIGSVLYSCSVLAESQNQSNECGRRSAIVEVAKEIKVTGFVNKEFSFAHRNSWCSRQARIEELNHCTFYCTRHCIPQRTDSMCQKMVRILRGTL
jgi:hypothetical protein